MKFLTLGSGKSKSANQRIFRGAFVVGFLTLVVKTASVVKELVVARCFGRSDALDAFLIAFVLPSSVVSLVTGALTSALVPVFVAAKEDEGAQAAQKLFSNMMLLSLIALAMIALLLGLLAPYYLPYLGSNFSPAKLELTRRLLYLLLPFMLFSGIAACASAVLNAGEKFATPAFAPLLTTLITILFLAFAAGKWSVFSLAAGVVAGGFLEAIVLVRALGANRVRFTLRWSGLDANVRAVLCQYAPMLAAVFFAGGTSLVDQSMAAMLQPGSVAALSYANKIVATILSIGAAALGTAAFPHFSRMVARNDWAGCRHTLKRYSVAVLAVTLPFTACLVAFAKPLVRLLFQRGSFNSADTDLVSWVQVCYAFQIPFYVLATLFVRFLSSARRNDVLLYTAAASLFLDVVFNLVLMKVMGIAGIALSSSLVYLFSLLFLAAWSIRVLAQQRVFASAVAASPEGIR